MNSLDFVLEEPVLQLRMKLDAARLLMGDQLERYYHNLDLDANTETGRLFIVRDFKTARIRAQAINDMLYDIECQLKAIENALDDVPSDTKTDAQFA